MFVNIKNACLLLIILFSIQSLKAETFRVRKVHPVTLHSASLSEQTVELGINDSLSLTLPKDKTFLSGIELKIEIPQAVANWRDSVAFSIYDNIKPEPKENIIDYEGKKIFVTTLPEKLMWLVQIPISENSNLKENSYISKINVLPNFSDERTFIRFQPAMKGVPDETYESTLKVTVKSILINKGLLNISVKNPEGNSQEYNLIIDDRQENPINGKILLSPGSHSISIQNENYRIENRTVFIEQAKETELNVSLRSTEPTLILNAPENAKILLDDADFSDIGKEIKISQGEHKIQCTIGGYQIIRSINIENGKSYTANLTVNLEITEE